MFQPARPAVPLLAFLLVATLPQISVAAPVSETAAAGGDARGASPGVPRPDGSGGWELTSRAIDPDDSHHAYVGNGYLGQRIAPSGTGYAASGEKTGWPLYNPRYDGSFVSGLYAHNKKTAENRQVLAALPTWSTLNVTAEGGRDGEKTETFSSDTPAKQISDYKQTLDMREGVVRTSLTWTAEDGRRTDLVYEVVADRNHRNTGAVRLRMNPHWSGEARVSDVIDGRGARRISPAGDGSVTAGDGDSGKGRTTGVSFRTHGTDTDGTVASTLRPGRGVRTGNEQKAAEQKELTARQDVTFKAHSGRAQEFHKYVGVDTALTSGSPERSAVAASRAAAERGWESLYADHTASWKRLWRGSIEVKGRPEMQRYVRSAQYGLFSATRKGADNSIAPTGLTSDNYAGSIFWDAETWMYPSLLAAHPELAKTVIDYRFRTRDGARKNAEKLGYKGLFYGWNSGSKGDLWKECHSWDPPHCKTQNHLQSDIALATWQYYLATDDTDWLRKRGWPLLKGIAEFWASRATRNDDGSYSVKNVAGPDEYSNGVDDGVFTNAGAATTLRHAARAAEQLGEKVPAKWATIAEKMRIPFDKKKGVFQQYEGYDGSVIKQADTVLLRYPLEWPMSRKTASKTLDYYAERSDPDGPAMTDSVHAVNAAEVGEPGCSAYTYLQRSSKPFARGPFSLFSEARGDKAGAEDPLAGSPSQDFLTGKGGFLQFFTNGLTGQRMREDRLKLDPMLPPQLEKGVELNGLHWQGRTYEIDLGAHRTTVRLTDGEPFRIETPQGEQVVSEGAPAVLKTRRPDQAATSNVARCQTARADSEQPGMYAGAAVDGSRATSWTPDGTDGKGEKGALTVDLGKSVAGARVTPEWTSAEPKSHRTEVSTDGKHWRSWSKGSDEPFRWVQVTVVSKDAKKPAGIEELRVTDK